jgi:CRISPR/Cas system CMR-associated protein Cmr1 (group 7 of RAMP superfamily)
MLVRTFAKLPRLKADKAKKLIEKYRKLSSGNIEIKKAKFIQEQEKATSFKAYEYECEF